MIKLETDSERFKFLLSSILWFVFNFYAFRIYFGPKILFQLF